MNLFAIYLTCILLTVSNPFLVFNSEAKQTFKGDFLNLRFKPIAINIDTSNIKKINPPTKLHLISKASASTLLVNTGQSIQTTNQRNNLQNISGGVLDNAYIYVSFNYYWVDGNSKKAAGTTVDGKGFPYEIRVLYRNSKYDTIVEAVHHRDGLMELILPYGKCLVSHRPIFNFNKIVEEIREAGSFTPVTLGLLISSADLNLNSFYYSYSGSFLDKYTNKRYECSTVIVVKPNPQYCISQKQFDESFGSVKNFQGQRYINTLTRDSREIQVSSFSGRTLLVIP